MRWIIFFVLGLIPSLPLRAQEVLPKPRNTVVPAPSSPVPKQVNPVDVLPESLTPPRILVLPQTVSPGVVVNSLPYPTGYYRRSSMEHWQHLSATSQGYMRPRVLLTPDGPVYSFDGRPFLFLNQEPRILGPAGTVP